MNYPDKVRIVEVGPRDGLQNEKSIISTDTKIKFINILSKSGLQNIEAGAFVSPKWVPQMADSAEVFNNIEKNPNISYPMLVPNQQGMEKALESGVQEIAIFAAASESFSQKNINCTIKESLDRFLPVIESAKDNNIKVRGYLSCVLGCPYEGDIAVETVSNTAKTLFDMGCYEISLGDTIGVGTPLKTERMLESVMLHINKENLAVHFHDTYGQALANILIALQKGIAVIDSSIGGLGGCPYAKGASGNVATEDVLYMLSGMGIKTGIDSASLKQASDFIFKYLDKESNSKYHLALNG